MFFLKPKEEEMKQQSEGRKRMIKSLATMAVFYASLRILGQYYNPK